MEHCGSLSISSIFFPTNNLRRGLDFAPLNQSALKLNTPIIVVQHGLTGGKLNLVSISYSPCLSEKTGSHESYVRAILSRACATVEEGGLGYRAVVINFRGCKLRYRLLDFHSDCVALIKKGAGVPITSPLLYSAGHTDDTRQALRYIAYLYPDAPILGIGFSLGANVLTRYLGEEKELSRVHAACVLGCVRSCTDSCCWNIFLTLMKSRGTSGRITRGMILSKFRL